MGTYGLTGEDIEQRFERWLHRQEGEVSAQTIADAWNALAKKHDWSDRLRVRYIEN